MHGTFIEIETKRKLDKDRDHGEKTLNNFPTLFSNGLNIKEYRMEEPFARLCLCQFNLMLFISAGKQIT